MGRGKVRVKVKVRLAGREGDEEVPSATLSDGFIDSTAK
jgi:hypothetical protein